MGSIALVFAFGGSRIAILVGILWCLFVSIGMYFWQGLGTDRALVGVPNEELIMPLSLK